MLWPGSSLPVSHTSNYKQNRTKESKLQPPSLPPPTTPSIIIQQNRVVVVVVVINGLYPSKTEPKNLNHNHQPPIQWVMCKCTLRAVLVIMGWVVVTGKHAPHDVVVLPADITLGVKDLRKYVDEAEAAFGGAGIDIMVHNAAAGRPVSSHCNMPILISPFQ